ncbi:histidine phosphatase family protein [Kistimonas scapharcae]|uniref:Histidine phosphatase family protein n=1 Tax=Kistimonas scapharcae TaxID=1036133 RepID=A0ABP8UZ44_9GAMM
MPRIVIIAVTLIMTLLHASSMPAKEKTLFLVRHGEADHNINGRYSTNPEHPAYTPSYLTDKGKEQVKCTADAIDTQLNREARIALFASPLPRTVQTAEILASHLRLTQHSIITDNRLIETNLGNREGQLHSQFDDKDPWFPDDPSTYDGETTEQINARLQSFYDEIISDNHTDILIIVTHGSPALLFAHLIQPDISHIRLETAGFGVFVITDE